MTQDSRTQSKLEQDIQSRIDSRVKKSTPLTLSVSTIRDPDPNLGQPTEVSGTSIGETVRVGSLSLGRLRVSLFLRTPQGL